MYLMYLTCETSLQKEKNTKNFCIFVKFLKGTIRDWLTFHLTARQPMRLEIRILYTLTFGILFSMGIGTSSDNILINVYTGMIRSRLPPPPYSVQRNADNDVIAHEQHVNSTCT